MQLRQDVTGEFFRVRLAPAAFYRGEGSSAIAEGWIRHAPWRWFRWIAWRGMAWLSLPSWDLGK